MKTPKTITAILLLLASLHIATASSTIPLSTPELVQASDAVFRGTVVGSACYKDSAGLIYTRTSLRVDEPLKGELPVVILVVHRGGRVGNQDEFYGGSPRFVGGEEYLLFVQRSSDGKLHSTQGTVSAVHLLPLDGGAEYAAPGQDMLNAVRALAAQGTLPGADVTDQAGSSEVQPQSISGMLGGVNSRFLQPDRGEPIPYLIDADSLPAGITLTQATNAVRQAFDAWAAVTSLQFKFEGIQSFGQGADTITNDDEKIRIQLHDNYNRITTANTLGVGGRSALTSLAPGTSWDLGGNVAGNEFQKSSRGYVVMEAGASSLQTLSTFAEVLCHEVGHALNMAHSSEVVTGDPVLSNAIMYFQAHADGRGATLGSYDPPIIQQIYPTNNTPPYTFHRVIDATTAPVNPGGSGINEVEIRGYDLQNSPLTVATNGASAPSGTFLLNGAILRFNPAGFFSDTVRVNPDPNVNPVPFFDVIYTRLSDGTNASPYALIRVISFRGEATASPDGIPDYWMTNFFGHTAPLAGDLSRATDDADGDGLNNRQEYLTGMNPRSTASAQRLVSITPGALQFQAKAYEPYEVLGSSDLINWTRLTTVVPITTSMAILTNLPQTNIIATVSNLPANSASMFFRVRKVP